LASLYTANRFKRFANSLAQLSLAQTGTFTVTPN
jgi:hypothetical protein